MKTRISYSIGKFFFTIFIIVSLYSLSISQIADYGDAPDSVMLNATFPSLKSSNGPRHTTASTSTYWIGWPEDTVATMEPDALVPDLDADMLPPPPISVWVIGIPAPSTISVPITTSSDHDPNQDIYLNVAIDVDNDLDYDDSRDPNWVVINKLVRLPADTTLLFTSGEFGFGSDLLLFPVWVRATVTSVPVETGWNIGQGNNTFTDGETADWIYRFTIGCDTAKRIKPTYPRVVRLKCEANNFFWMGIKNLGKDSVYFIDVDFMFQAGIPLLQPPRIVQVAPGPPFLFCLPPGKTVWIKYSVPGWKCDGLHKWAKYKITISKDPNGLFEKEEFFIEFNASELPDFGPFAIPQIPAGPVNDTLDSEPWIGKIEELMIKHLVAWTGYYPDSSRWIEGEPLIEPVEIPDWATFQVTKVSFDSTYYSFSGTPGYFDNGIDTAVFIIKSTNPADNIDPWIYKVPIAIENVNNPPVFISDPPKVDTFLLNTSKGDSLRIDFEFSAEDIDVIRGKRDTIFWDFFIFDLEKQMPHTSVGPLKIDFGHAGQASFTWKPQEQDDGRYQIFAQASDYYFGFENRALAIGEVVTIVQNNEIKNNSNFIIEDLSPNPFIKTTSFFFELPESGNVSVRVYDALGNFIQQLMDSNLSAGPHTVIWDSGDLPNGTYFIRFTSGASRTVLKAVKAK